VNLGRPRAIGALATAVSATLLLSSCAGTAPGVAAEVDGTRITDRQVDDFAGVLCALGGVAGTESGVPSRGARLRSLEILLSIETTRALTDIGEADAQLVSGSMAALNEARGEVPADLLDTFDEVALAFSQSQNALLGLGRDRLGEGGDPGQVDDQAAFEEGDRLRREFAETAQIDLDPRFGSYIDGAVQPADGSLSVPVSDLAVLAQAPLEGPDEALVSQLPASQKCG